MRITEKLADWLVKEHRQVPVMPGADAETYKYSYRRKIASLMADAIGKDDPDPEDLTAEKYLELTAGQPTLAEYESNEEHNTGGPKMSNNPDPEKLLGGTENIKVLSESQKYSEKRFSATHAKTGKPVFNPFSQRVCETPSEASSARAGVFFKHLAARAGVGVVLKEHEENLLSEMCEKQEWCGEIGSDHFESITGDRRVKQLIDDALPGSGGVSIVPREFDSDIITFPLLGVELFPLVDIRPVEGRRIEGASLATPTMLWGGGDGANIALFGTGAMCNALNSTVFVVDGAILVGRDFLSDSPVNVGQVLTQMVGNRLSNELDRVIANGLGVVEPVGIFQAAGVGAVVTANGAVGPPTMGDYAALMFGVAKAYRKQNLNCAFISNDVTYARSRQIAVDPAVASTDQRPVLADVNSFENYMSLGRTHRVETNLPNTVAAFVAMMKYRLYRRVGLEIRFTSEGVTLSRANEVLMTYRARYAGRLMDPAACARWANGQV